MCVNNINRVLFLNKMSKLKDFFKCLKKENNDSLIIDDGDQQTFNNGIPRGSKPYRNGKALLIGINYTGTSSQLNGCINDVNNMFRYLTTVENFNPDNIHILVDERHAKNLPTRENIIKEIKWLVEDPYKNLAKEAKPKTSLFMHYSGHGSWTWDRINTDEVDGRDETICPLDYEKNGLIKDDELRQMIVEPLKELGHIKLTTVFDCCHSGTVLDLRYNLQSKVDPKDPLSRELTITENKNYSKTEAEIISFSGSMDNQYSADAYINRQSQGMMTYAYLETINLFNKNNKNLTYKKFITALQVYAKENKYDQVPQLSMNSCPELTEEYKI